MQPTAALGSLCLTLLLVVTRPTIGRFGRMNPVLGALPGVLVMLLAGVLRPSDIGRGFLLLWRPLVTIASIMATTSMAHRLGIFDRVARAIEIRTRGPVPHAFRAVYVISVGTAALFNNDAAILLLTPIVLPLIRRLYPRRQGVLVVPFAFAVFMAAGVAPLSTSNPMNLVVAEHAGLGFNAYALRMIPVSLAGAVTTYVMLRFAFRDSGVQVRLDVQRLNERIRVEEQLQHRHQQFAYPAQRSTCRFEQRVLFEREVRQFWWSIRRLCFAVLLEQIGSQTAWVEKLFELDAGEFANLRLGVVDTALLANARANLLHDLLDVDRVGTNVEIGHGQGTNGW